MKRTLLFRFITLLVLATPTIVCAELGSNAASVQADQARMKASVMQTTKVSPDFSVQQSQTPTGVTIKEFVSSTTGTVFAVTWEGPLLPNMQQLLGQYFGSYVAAAKTNRGGHSHLSIQQTDLVVQSGGHMRAFSGIAYIPSLMPAGVTVAQLH